MGAEVPTLTSGLCQAKPPSHLSAELRGPTFYPRPKQGPWADLRVDQRLTGLRTKGDLSSPQGQVCTLRSEPPPVGAVGLGESLCLPYLDLSPCFENGVLQHPPCRAIVRMERRRGRAWWTIMRFIN